jgi:hypothetical protein
VRVERRERERDEAVGNVREEGGGHGEPRAEEGVGPLVCGREGELEAKCEEHCEAEVRALLVLVVEFLGALEDELCRVRVIRVRVRVRVRMRILQGEG